MHRLLLTGLNHTTAPLEVRERIAFAGDQRRIALEAFCARYPEAEAVLVSTCNRVELYVARSVHGHPREDEMLEFLASFHSIPVSDVAPHLYRKANRQVVEHLFLVTSSLDSMVLGETQILGQVREAYDLARSVRAARSMLHPLFQRAIGVGKQVMSETKLGEGRLSVASVAVEYASRIFDHFGDKTVLSIGAGKMATLVLQSFAALKPGKLLVCNRDVGKAAALAQRFNGQAVPFERLADHLAQADVVISSTGSPHAIITRQQFDAILPRRRWRPIFLIDIALPRDIEAAVGEVQNVYLYNIDDLQQVVAETQQQRAALVDSARQIVLKQVDEFESSQRARAIGPLIDRLYKRYHLIAGEEAQRTLHKLNGLDPAQRDQVEELARRIVNKILHDPVHALRQGQDPGVSPIAPLGALERLFNLADEPPAHEGEPREQPPEG